MIWTFIVRLLISSSEICSWLKYLLNFTAYHYFDCLHLLSLNLKWVPWLFCYRRCPIYGNFLNYIISDSRPAGRSAKPLVNHNRDKWKIGLGVSRWLYSFSVRNSKVCESLHVVSRVPWLARLWDFNQRSPRDRSAPTPWPWTRWSL